MTLDPDHARYFIVTYPDVCRELRRMLNMTLEQMGAASGIGFVRIHRWEKGKTTPEPNTAANYLGYLLDSATDAGINIEQTMLRVLTRRPKPWEIAAAVKAAAKVTQESEQDDGDDLGRLVNVGIRAASAYKGSKP